METGFFTQTSFYDQRTFENVHVKKELKKSRHEFYKVFTKEFLQDFTVFPERALNPTEKAARIRW